MFILYLQYCYLFIQFRQSSAVVIYRMQGGKVALKEKKENLIFWQEGGERRAGRERQKSFHFLSRNLAELQSPWNEHHRQWNEPWCQRYLNFSIWNKTNNIKTDTWNVNEKIYGDKIIHKIAFIANFSRHFNWNLWIF